MEASGGGVKRRSRSHTEATAGGRDQETCVEQAIGRPGNRLAPYQLHAVSVLKSLALATALVIGASTLADAASRQRGRSIPRPSGAYPQYPTTAPVTAGSYGGYSADPHTRYLEMLADEHRGGW
jgi:hypothetical protein